MQYGIDLGGGWYAGDACAPRRLTKVPAGMLESPAVKPLLLAITGELMMFTINKSSCLTITTKKEVVEYHKKYATVAD